MKNFREKVIEMIRDLDSVEKGSVYFSFENTQSAHHRTFKISKSDFAEGKLVIGLLTGSDNEFAYTNFGFINPTTGQVNLWRKYEYDSTFPKYAKMMQGMFQNTLPDYINAHHSGKCFRCGRQLTTPESIESGIGPICINS